MWISTRNSRTGQKLSKWLQRQELKLTTRSTERKSQQCVKWPETLGEHVSVVDANAWVIMHCRSFVFVVSLFVVSYCRCLLTVFLDSCTYTVAQVCALFTPSSSSCFMRTLSDLFDFSIHLISYLFISLIFLLFLLPYTFYFLDVVDNKPALFRWGAGPPGQKELSHRLWAQRPLHHGGLCRVHPGLLDRATVPWRLRLRWHHHRSDAP